MQTPWTSENETMYQQTIKVYIDTLDFHTLRVIARTFDITGLSKTKLISDLHDYLELNCPPVSVTHAMLQARAKFLDSSELKDKSCGAYKAIMMVAPPRGGSLPTPTGAIKNIPVPMTAVAPTAPVAPPMNYGVLSVSYNLGTGSKACRPLPIVSSIPLSTVFVRCLCNTVTIVNKDAQPPNSLVMCHICNIYQHTACVIYKTPNPSQQHTCEQCRIQKCLAERDPFVKVICAQIPVSVPDKGKVRIFVANTTSPATVMCVPMQQDLPPTWLPNLHATLITPTGKTSRLQIGSSGIPPRSVIEASIQPGTPPCILSVFWTEKASPEQVRANMGASLTLDESLKRVKDHFKNDDIEMLSERVSLRCPLSMSRIVTPARFDGSPMLGGAFDLDTFIACGKWQCPVTGKRYYASSLRVDTFLQKVLKDVGSDIMEIEVSSDGSWKAINGRTQSNTDSRSTKRQRFGNDDDVSSSKIKCRECINLVD